MFNKLREAIALAEEQEFEEEALDYTLFDEKFDMMIEDVVNIDITRLIMEEMDLYDNDTILMEAAEDAEFDEEEEIEGEEIEDEELEDLLESVLEDF